MAALTLDQKIGQLVCGKDRHLNSLTDAQGYLAKYPLGSVFVGAEIIQQDTDNTDKVRETVNRLKAATAIPLLFCGDFEHGVGSEVSGLTRFPDLMTLGATNDPQLAYEYGKAIAVEALSLGVRWSFAPVVDLNTNLNNPVTNQRSVGEDPEKALSILKPHIRGMQENGMAAAAKHFPGDGTDDRNQHMVTSVNSLSITRWRHLHGRVFKELIDAGVQSIMVGHLALPAYEKADRKTGRYRPATASRKVMTDLLRGELGFQGVIVTDALSMCGFCSWAPYEQRILDCFNGGADVFLWPDTEKFFALMRQALSDGRISPERLEESVKRILQFKAVLGVHEARTPERLSAEALARHRSVSDAIAEKSVTLLRNKQVVLPLRLPSGSNVLMLVVESSKPDLNRFAVLRDEFIRRGCVVTLAEFESFGQYRQALAQYAAVLVLGNIGTLNCGGSTMRVVGPAAGQIWPFMANAHEKAVYISFGNPYFLHEIASAPIYINAYSNCAATQTAVARAILGEIPFQGHSPVSCPFAFRLGDGVGKAMGKK